MSIVKTPFGRLPDGRPADLYRIENASGAAVCISNYGGILTALAVPDRSGRMTDVLLGYSDISGYAPDNPAYMGALIGRAANRIKRGRFTLNGAACQLNVNAGGHHLHGGASGFDKKLWDARADEASGSLTLSAVSPDGEERYPGRMHVTVVYTFSDDNALTIHYRAVSDRNTLCNLTNHAYFNLSGEGSATIEDHVLQIFAGRVTVSDRDLIPTGELRPVDGTPFDLRRPVRIGDGLARTDDEQLRFGGGYDHNFMLDGQGFRQAAVLTSPLTGIRMNVLTDMPGVQLYTGNALEGARPGKSGARYARRGGLCLETQLPPDAINHPHFPSPILPAGKPFESTTAYVFDTD